MELNIKNTTVHDTACVGCKRQKKDVMVSLMAEETGNQIHDFFMTNEQAKDLVSQINKAIQYNEE